MGFIFILTAAFCNVAKGYGSKRISHCVNGLSATMDVAMLRNFLCAIIGAFIIAMSGFQNFTMPPIGWLICFIAGIAIGLNYVVWVMALRSGVYVLSNAANTASFIIATLCGAFFWKEQFTLIKGLTILLMSISMLFMGKYQTELKGKLTRKHLLLLFLIFLSAGVSSATQKWFTLELPNTSAHIYTFYSLLISGFLLLFASLFSREQSALKERVKNIKSLFGWIILIAVCFYAVTFFQTKAAALLDAIVMYPIYNGTLLLAGNCMAWLCFSEKPNKNSIIGAILVFFAVVLAGL